MAASARKVRIVAKPTKKQVSAGASTPYGRRLVTTHRGVITGRTVRVRPLIVRADRG